MELYRTIRTSFWTDRKVCEDFTCEDKYFYLYLFTNPHTNLLGCYEIGIRQMSIETGYEEMTIRKLIDRFTNIHKVIEYDFETNELLIKNWHKYNWTKSAQLLKGISKQLEQVKSKSYIEYLEGIYRVYRGYIEGMGTTNTNTNSNTLTNSNSNNINKIIDKNINTIANYDENSLPKNIEEYLKRKDRI